MKSPTTPNDPIPTRRFSSPPTHHRRSHEAASLTLLALAALLPGTALAGPADPRWQVAGDVVEVRVLVGDRVTPLYEAAGKVDRSYFEAVKGRNYALSVRNNSGERVGVLISVDGLNVVSGERSSLGNHESMYVLAPWEEATIRGWRTSLDEVRRFVFVDEERSYAERTGQANGDLGWIRVLAFREEGVRRRCGNDLGLDDGRANRPESDRADAGDAAGAPPPVASDEAPSGAEVGRAKSKPGADRLAERQTREREESNPGTGWGDRSRDVVQRTTFLAEARATDRVVLRYEYASGLLALGIDCRPRRDRLTERENGLFGFARPPRGW
jgi:hypothetical protein